MTAVESQLDETEAARARRTQRRRSSRISKSSTMAIRSVVAKMSGDPARIPLVDGGNSEDEGESTSSQEGHKSLTAVVTSSGPQNTADDTKSIGTRMSFSELIPKEPVRIEVMEPEAPAPTRTLLRRPSGNCLGAQLEESSNHNNTCTTFNDSSTSLLSKGSLDPLDFADEDSFSDESQHTDQWNESSSHHMAISRVSSLGMMSTSTSEDMDSDDDDDDDDYSDCDYSRGPEHALQFLPPELNTLLNLSPEHPVGKISIPDDVIPPKMMVDSLTDTEAVPKKGPKPRRPSKGERVLKRRKSAATPNDSVRSTRTSGTKGTKEESRRPSRSERRTSKISRRRASSVEIKDSSIRKRVETKETSVKKRSSNIEMKETSFRRRMEGMDSSSRRRNTTCEMADSSERRSRIVDSSIRRSRLSSSVHESSTRRSRKAMNDSSASRDVMKDSSSFRGVRRGSSAKPKPRKVESDGSSDRQVIRRSSYCLPSEVPEELRNPPMRSFSSTNDMHVIPGTSGDNVDTTCGKRLSRRNPSTTTKSSGKAPSTRPARQSASRTEGGSKRVGRRTSYRSPAMQRSSQSHQRRSRSCAPTEQDAMPGPPNLSRRVSADDSRAYPGDIKVKHAHRRPHSDDDDDDEGILIVKPLQLVFDPVAAESDRAVISCQKASFPSHYSYGDLAKLNSSQRSVRLTGSKANKEGLEMAGGSQHSAKTSEKAPRNGSVSNLHRSSKQFRQQKPSRTRALHESFMF